MEPATRPLASADLPAVVRLHRELFRVRSSARFLERAYYPTFLDRAAGGLGRVAEDDAGLAGFGVATLDDGAFHRRLLRAHPLACLAAALGARGRAREARSRLGPAVARVHYLAVAPRARGRGVGGRLLRELLAAARSGGARACATRVYLDNAASRRLMEAAGGRIEAEGEDALGRFALYGFALDG